MTELLGKLVGVPNGSRYTDIIHPELRPEIDVEGTIARIISEAGGE